MASFTGIEEAYKNKNKKIDDLVAAEGNAYDAQRDDVNTNTQSTLQQIYLQKERDQALQKQINKAAGITGGASESAATALQANYATNRTNTMLERDKQISQINRDQELAKAEAEEKKADNDLAMEQERLSFLRDEDQKELDEKYYGLEERGVAVQEGQLKNDTISLGYEERGVAVQEGQLEVSKAEAATSQSALDYEKQQNRESTLWEIVKSGVVTQAIADELGQPYEVLKQLADIYKENLLNG